MVNETATLALMAIAGTALGAFFFGGLWLTTHMGLRSRHPAVWFAVSFLVRTALTLVGFYYLSAGQWERLVACLAGFFAARTLATRLSKLWPGEETHAPEP